VTGQALPRKNFFSGIAWNQRKPREMLYEERGLTCYLLTAL